MICAWTVTSPWLSLAEPLAAFSNHLSSSIRPGQQGDLPHQPSLAYKSPSSMPCVTWHHRAGVQPLLSRSIVYLFKIVRGKNQEKITQKNQLTTQRQHYLVVVRKFWPSERPLMVYFLGWILWSLRDPECFTKQIFWPPSDEYYYCLFKYQFWSLKLTAIGLTTCSIGHYHKSTFPVCHEAPSPQGCSWNVSLLRCSYV